MVENILDEIHAVSPYEGFCAEEYECDLHGWLKNEHVFITLLEKHRPNLIIEVGTWKGASAVTMGEHVKRMGLKTKIICVDTWLGAPEFWLDKSDPERYLSLKLKNGYPSVYYQFLANVMHCGLEDVIVPFPQNSSNAFIWFQQRNIKADLIYIDASHEFLDVYLDILNFSKVLADRGCIFGDDYEDFWPGVKGAVDKITKDKNLELEILDDRYWALVNTPAFQSDLSCAHIISNFAAWEKYQKKTSDGLKEKAHAVERLKNELIDIRADRDRCRSELNHIKGLKGWKILDYIYRKLHRVE